LIKDRITLIPDIYSNAVLFYFAPESFDEQVRERIWKPETGGMVRSILKELQSLPLWNHETIYAAIRDYTDRTGIKMGQLMNPLRLLVVGANQGPGMMDIAETLGKEEFLLRIEDGLKKI
jgi:glutamyl-tRNA synthetase